MTKHVGFLLQFAALVFLPVLIVWELTWGFRLIYMPALLAVGWGVFHIGTKLRES